MMNLRPRGTLEVDLEKELAAALNQFRGIAEAQEFILQNEGPQASTLIAELPSAQEPSVPVSRMGGGVEGGGI